MGRTFSPKLKPSPRQLSTNTTSPASPSSLSFSIAPPRTAPPGSSLNPTRNQSRPESSSESDSSRDELIKKTYSRQSKRASKKGVSSELDELEMGTNKRPAEQQEPHPDTAQPTLNPSAKKPRTRASKSKAKRAQLQLDSQMDKSQLGFDLDRSAATDEQHGDAEEGEVPEEPLFMVDLTPAAIAHEHAYVEAPNPPDDDQAEPGEGADALRTEEQTMRAFADEVLMLDSDDEDDDDDDDDSDGERGESEGPQPYRELAEDEYTLAEAIKGKIIDDSAAKVSCCTKDARNSTLT